MKNSELENLGLSELGANDLMELNGGGWIADWVAGVVNAWKCDCTVADRGDPMDWPVNTHR